jgi:integrase
MRALTEEQVGILLNAIKGARLEALYILALSTGMREGELLGLRWGDVDLAQNSLQITSSLQESEAGPSRFVIGEPKTAQSRRRIALSQAAATALRAHRERQERERCNGKGIWDESYDLVFPNTLGKPLQRSHLLKREFRPLLERANLPPIRFHDLRHTAATLLLGRGVNPKVVSEMLGHANISITLDVYSHVMPDMQQAAAATMDDVLLHKGE